MSSRTMTPRAALVHRLLHPMHRTVRHPKDSYVVYCRTCYIIDRRKGRRLR